MVNIGSSVRAHSKYIAERLVRSAAVKSEVGRRNVHEKFKMK